MVVTLLAEQDATPGKVKAVGFGRYCPPRSRIVSTMRSTLERWKGSHAFDLCVLSYVASNDVASDICWALEGGGDPGIAVMERGGAAVGRAWDPIVYS